MIKHKIKFMLIALSIGLNIYANNTSQWITFSPDLTSILKNPAMGWMMYEEGWSFARMGTDNIYNPDIFWKQMEECNAMSYSNILYIRVLWKDLEPEENKYAWLYNEKYRWYIQKAKSPISLFFYLCKLLNIKLL